MEGKHSLTVQYEVKRVINKIEERLSRLIRDKVNKFFSNDLPL